jgi:hypothetical protein
MKDEKLTPPVRVLYGIPSVFVVEAYSVPYLPKYKTTPLHSHGV